MGHRRWLYLKGRRRFDAVDVVTALCRQLRLHPAIVVHGKPSAWLDKEGLAQDRELP